MALVIAGLSAYPCNDTDVCVDDQKFSYSILDANDFHTSDVDFCTPFCICSCCAAHIQVPSTFTYDLEQPISSSFFVSYVAVFVDRLSYSIWQPPKLA
jgi:hypothetical protein